VDLAEIERWSLAEGQETRFAEVKERLRSAAMRRQDLGPEIS